MNMGNEPESATVTRTTGHHRRSSCIVPAPCSILAPTLHIDQDFIFKMHSDRTINELLVECPRFRILSIGRAGAGKSSLINRVFQVNDAKVSHFNPGEADIYAEITSETNTRFVLHDSKGFEPSTRDTIEVVRKFILDKSDTSLELRDRLHAAWLCIRTPTHGGRVLETGDEEILELAYKRNVPVVVVFTQYDRLVRKYPENGEESAQKVLDDHVKSLRDAANRLEIEMPAYINVSKQKGYDKNILPLKQLPGADAFFIWATAQMISLPVKIRAYYSRALIATSSIPAIGQPLLHHRLVEVHQDIVICLNGVDFRQLLLYVVQDMRNKEDTKSSPLDFEKISQFVQLCATASAAFAQPAAILGLSFAFFKWILDAVCDNVYISVISTQIFFSPIFRRPEVQRVFIAYTVDLILVLRELFDFTLQPQKAGRVTWDDLGEAWAAYHRTPSQAEVHSKITELVKKHKGLSADSTAIRMNVGELVYKHANV
ncbi:hypothetical protein B0H14DRAFT_2728299 [Mycena olivaceomarginata]|nr:hypothetical protein B0H14DRAFT_2728299 [Mycena olivaceomarginata]